MPYAIEKVEGKRCYRVVNTETGQEHAKCTTKKKAEAQVRVLEDAAMSAPAPAPAKTTWRQFYTDAIKGKKFGSREEVNMFMRETAKKYKGL